MNRATMEALFDFKDALGDLEYRLIDAKTSKKELFRLSKKLFLLWNKLDARVAHEITQL